MTKKAIAAALKELTLTEPFSKISIGDICKQCKVSRKTFYYHFKDKDDLVNWIFDTEFVLRSQKKTYTSVWQGLEDLFRYFYRNHAFYRKVLEQTGPNSFAFYFNDLLHSVFVDHLKAILGDAHVSEIQVNFLADGVVCMLKRWLAQSDCPTPEDLIGELKTGTGILAGYIFHTMPNEQSRSENEK